MGRRRRHNARSRVALAVTSAVILGACGEDTPPAADVLVSHPTWTPEQAWSVAPEPRLSIGVVAGNGVYQFDDVSAATRLHDGRIVVAEGRAARVRVYDDQGRYLYRLGGPGDGPGEFRQPTQVIAHPDGAVDIWDSAAWRRTRFDADGVLVEVRTTGLRELASLIEPPRYPAAAHLLSDGALIVETVLKDVAAGKSGFLTEPGEVIREEREVVLVDAVLTETAGRGSLLGTEQIVVEAPWGPQPMITPLAPRIRIASQPGSETHCLGDQSGPVVHCFAAGGTSWDVTWSARPLSFDEDGRLIAEWRSDTHRLYGGKLPADQVDDLLDQLPLPEAWPAWSAVHIDRARNLWVGLGPSGDSYEYWVFDGEGALLGAVAVPPMRIVEIGEDYLLGVRIDDVDVQHVQLLDLTKPNPS